MRVLQIGDAVLGAKSGRKLPAGYDNVETMLAKVAQRGEEMSPGCRCSTKVQLGQWTTQADKALVF